MNHPDRPVIIVDAFTRSPGHGNRAGLVVDAQALNEAAMLAVAVNDRNAELLARRMLTNTPTPSATPSSVSSVRVFSRASWRATTQRNTDRTAFTAGARYRPRPIGRR